MKASPDVPRAPRRRYFTTGVWLVSAVALLGGAVLIGRFTTGLGATTNLSEGYPWGIWIGLDVACGVALAAGGFTAAFLVHIAHRERYHVLLRPALLTALIGYTFVALGVTTDLGRFWALWHVPLPWMWQPNSVLFEVAMCVMTYLTVLYIEFLPTVCARIRGRVRLPGRLARLDGCTERLLAVVDTSVDRVLTVFVILGIVLSCMHQSSLGTLMIITGPKLHPLWQTPILPLLFLLSAFAVGFPMVIFESVVAARSFGLAPERDALSGLARFIPMLLALYAGVRFIDLLARRELWRVTAGDRASMLFALETTLGVLLPLMLFLSPRRRRSIGWLFAGSCLVISGVVLNRLNVFLLCYTPVRFGAAYSPAWTEVAVTAGFVAMIVLIYRFIALNFPVLEALNAHRLLATATAPATIRRRRLVPQARRLATRRRPAPRRATELAPERAPERTPERTTV